MYAPHVLPRLSPLSDGKNVLEKSTMHLLPTGLNMSLWLRLARKRLGPGKEKNSLLFFSVEERQEESVRRATYSLEAGPTTLDLASKAI